VPPVGLEFGQSNFSFSEAAGQAVVTVRRPDGQTETPVNVNYATSNGTALAGQDYTPASGSLLFNVGEFSKSFTVPIIDDSIFEPGGAEFFNVTLSNPVGSVVGLQGTARVSIADDESDNPINDPAFYVTQQYQDFLGRAPEAGGFGYWTGQITSCGANSLCINRRRVEVSAAFFLSPEFFDTGGFLYRFYRISFTRFPTYSEFIQDQTPVVGGPDLEARQRNFAEQWVLRPEFASRYNQLNSVNYVDTLFANAGVTPDGETRTTLILSLATGVLTRAQVLLRISAIALADNGFRQRENNRLFVLMQYLGYLRRDPDQAGFNFWLNLLNQSPNNIPGMACAFITSTEYQRRFGMSVTRTNAECNQLGF
jgi:hypothetical protein